MIVAGFILRHALHCHTVRQQVLASVALAVAPSSSSPSSLLQSDTGKLSAGQTVLQDKQALLSKISGGVNRWLNLKTRHRHCSFEWLWCFSACWCLVTYVICRDLFVCLGRGKCIVAVIWHLIYVGGLISNLFACQTVLPESVSDLAGTEWLSLKPFVLSVLWPWRISDWESCSHAICTC